MSVIPKTFKCDACGRTRTATELPEKYQWYELHHDDTNKPGGLYNEPSLLIKLFSSNTAPGVTHYCSEACLLKGIEAKLFKLSPTSSGAPSVAEVSKKLAMQKNAGTEYDRAPAGCTCMYNVISGEKISTHTDCPVHSPRPAVASTKWDGDDQAASSICTCTAVSNPACPVHGYEV